ncbi:MULTISPECIES: hypothetical protein [unclassified Crossiella]|uniref:hypothetical protein n=1 Tax=unclassified Crossiella TaxID=2620835 RepID=UPI001FFFCB52|nr:MULTISPECIES: hypothetical protein [unclassified Crossiella]MCK2243309.1 hypothetical protein [Crossiella sp. S99.2]MCK2254222.1 hypothetical protein [Crossiella sp. S99.1]
MVKHGNVITAAGVSAGMDMALHLAAALWGREAAQRAQALIEYAPEPPFTAGNPDQLPPALGAALRESMKTHVSQAKHGRPHAL